MNENKTNRNLRRGGALLLATVLCLSALTGCAGAKKPAGGKTQTQQSQQAAPKADTGKKDAGKKDSGKKSSPGKSAGGQNNSGKSSSGKNNPGKPSGGQISPGKPSGGQTSPGKPSGGQTSPGKPSGGQSSSGKPSGGQSSPGKPSGGQSSPGKPSGGQTSPGAPSGGQSVTAKPSPPSIKTQPVNAKVAIGSSFAFKVSAIGENLKYTWQVDKNDGKGWADIPDANSDSYTVKNISKDQTGWKYRCVVSNEAGKAESTTAILTVDPSVKAKQG